MGKYRKPPWCDGKIKTCLGCPVTDSCNVPIFREEAAAMRIGESLDGKGFRGNQSKTKKNAKERDRYNADPVFRARKRELAKKRRARMKEAEQAV